MSQVRVIIADDHPVVRIGTRITINASGLGRVVGEADQPAELFALLARQPCDVLVTDYTMPGGKHADGLLMLGRIRREHPRLPIVLQSISSHPGVIGSARRIGVLGFVDKQDTGRETLMAAIEHALQHRRYISPTLRTQACPAGTPAPRPPGSLTPREQEVLRLMASGLSMKQIADQQSRSISTISRQKMDAMQKLGLGSNAALFDYLRHARL